VLAVRAHGGSQGQVLGGGLVVTGAGEGEAEAEVRVVVGWARLDDHPEVFRGGRVLAGVELGPGQGLPDAARARLRVRRPLQHLRRGRGTALPEEFHAGGVPGVHVTGVWTGRPVAPGFARYAALVAGGARGVFVGRGIPAAAWYFRHGVQTLFPSGDGSDPGVGLLVTPFRGVRYDLSRVGGLANVTSPPYDVIGPGTLERLLAASPYNVVRLILPGGTLGDSVDAAGAPEVDQHTAGEVAAARLHDWLASGALAVDDAPALYVYEQRGADWLQRGLIGLVAVGTAAVLPHEGVMPGPVAGRRELMKSTQSNFEPILLVYNGGPTGSGSGPGGPAGPAGVNPADVGTASQLTDLTADSQAPLACAVTSDGVTHRLWAVTDPAVQAAVAADLATRTALIADGHHRYAAYRGLQADMRDSGAGAGPWDYGLAFLVDADAYPLRLGAIHRVLPHLHPAEAARLAASGFTVTPVAPAEAAGRLAAAGESGTAFLLAGEGGCWLLTDPEQEQLAAAMPPGASPRWQALDASVMQELLLAQLWSVKDNVRDVLISHDADEAIGMALDSGGTAVICNPMPLTAVMEIAAHGEKVPRKSTSFGPKPRTGLVLRTFAD
jgi:uncharacterized protein (DUF1015 family)